MERILNVIVYYNNYLEIVEYLSSLFEISNDMVDVIVVVNSDKQNELNLLLEDIASRKWDNVLIKDYGKNLGYLNAFLFSVRDIEIVQYKYLILSNTDIKYIDSKFMIELYNTSYPKGIGCIAPNVYATKTNSYSNPRDLHRISKGKYLFLEKLFSYPILAKQYLRLSMMKALIRSKRKPPVAKPSCYVYSPHGCYMIFTNAFVKQIQNYRYGAIMYSEEAAIGELLIRNHMKCFYDNKLRIEHNESASTGKINYKTRFTMWRKSITYILDEFYK